MKIILAIIAALAAVTFPIYFVVFIFKSLVLGIMTAVVTTLWAFGQLFTRLNVFGKKNRKKDIKLIGR